MLSSSTSSTSSTGTGVPSSMSVVSLMPGSPSGEICDENSSRFSAYLHRLAGYSEDDANIALMDHCYARPWNWKPENIYVKPAKKIFFSKSTETRFERENSDEFADVEERRAEDSPMPHDLVRSRHQMDEFQRLANFARPEENEGDWEDKIEKILWLPVHHRIFSKVMRILTSERLARLAKSNFSTEPIFRRNSIDTAARRFRETLASTGWNSKTTQWLHGLLFDHLPREYLAIYLDILQTLRLKMPQLIDRMMSVQPNINGKSGSITWETLGSLLKRSWDPIAATLNSNRPTKLPGNPILILAPSGINTSTSSRQHKWISQLGNLGMIVNVHTHLGIAANRMTMMTCMDQLVQATRAKIQDVRVDCPGRAIIIVGFNSGAALACQVAQMEHVTAVICLGFPFMTVEGKRGTPDDTLMDMRCPVMFVIGENASLVRAHDLEDVREKMLVETSLVVVGTADDHLRISTAKKISDGITQSIVDRCIINEIGDFVAGILLQPYPLPLRTVSLSSFENPRITKKEPRKRKNSTSSSVDSESNSPNVKKSRPATPVTSAIISSINNTAPISVGSKPLPIVTSHTTLVTTIGATSVSSSATQTSMPRKKIKVPNYQKYNFSEKMVTSRNSSQQTLSSGNGGITLNIGSLASLAPIGPIRLAPMVASQNLTAPNSSSSSTTTATTIKGNVNSRSPMTLTKIPKIVQIKTPQMPTMKHKTNIPTLSKGLSKVIPANYSMSGNELKSINVSATISANAASQNKTTANTSTSGSLTALLQAGKSTLGFGGTNSIASHGTPVSTGIILLTSKVGSGPKAGTITTEPTSKVTDIGAGIDGNGINDNSIKTNSTMSTMKNHYQDGIAASSPISSPILVPVTNKTPITILPMSGQRAKTLQKNSSKIVPKITFNSHNFHKNQCGLHSLSLTKKCMDIDEDLGNILDIPIIFAKDGDNLGMIEKASTPPRPLHVPTTIESVEKTVKRLSPTTKVVLISNKQDKGKTFKQCGQNFVRPSVNNQSLTTAAAAHQVLLHSRSQNQSQMSIGPNWHGLPLQNLSRSNQSTIKYTKIILAKRNSLTSNALDGTEKNEQVVLTKSAPKVSKPTIQEKNEHVYTPQLPTILTTSDLHVNDTLEIEDAIKTNIIERKLVTIPEIDLTSPIKNQAAIEALMSVARQTGDE